MSADWRDGWSAGDLDLVASALRGSPGDEIEVWVDAVRRRAYLWTQDSGLDGDEEVDEDALEAMGLVFVEPVDSHVWYEVMADFVRGLPSGAARDDLSRALQQRKPFRRFRDVLHQRHPDLIADWHRFEEEAEQEQLRSWLADLS